MNKIGEKQPQLFVLLQRMKRIAILGAGAAGLFAAAQLSKHSDLSVVVFEKSKNIAAKLRASGGGRANILNEHIGPECYNHPEFMSDFLRQTDFQTLYSEFENMGLMMRSDEEHRVYPATFFSTTVVDVLLKNLSKNVQIITDYEVKSLTREKQQWQINDFPTLFDQVLLMVGSPAGIARQSQNFAAFLNPLDIHFHPFKPSLVGFKLIQYPKYLYGCRAKAEVSLYQQNRIVFQERGEVTFKEEGISGIVVMNASAYYNRLKSPVNCTLSLNFLYDEDFDISDYLRKYQDFSGILHPKLCKLYAQSSFNPRALQWRIEGTYDLSAAQVAHGGIDVGEVDEFLQLKRYPHLYVGGELLDIDGVCGGYNLFFAFASAYWIVKNLFRED